MFKRKIFSDFAIALISLLMLVGLLLEIFSIPQLSKELSSAYVEYRGDGLLIQMLLTSLTITGQAILISISSLLWKVRNRQLLSKQSFAHTRALAFGFLLMSIEILVLITWLIGKNTLPPSIGISLVIGLFLSAIAYLVTRSLTEVLKEATHARVELESVI